jgi:hypothetical protein
MDPMLGQNKVFITWADQVPVNQRASRIGPEQRMPLSLSVVPHIQRLQTPGR